VHNSYMEVQFIPRGMVGDIIHTSRYDLCIIHTWRYEL
jgi:hypothetical protein